MKMCRASVILLALLSSLAIAQEPVRMPQQRTLSSLNATPIGGRFVFGQISDFRSDQYMLDTQTGRLWKVVVLKSEQGAEFESLRPVVYQSGDDNRPYSLTPK